MPNGKYLPIRVQQNVLENLNGSNQRFIMLWQVVQRYNVKCLCSVDPTNDLIDGTESKYASPSLCVHLTTTWYFF